MPHKDLEKKREYDRAWRLRNLDKERERKRVYMSEVYPKEKIKSASIRWLEKLASSYPDKLEVRKTRNRKRAREWAKNNPEKVYASIGSRRAKKLRASPPWVDQNAIDEIYRKAKMLSIDSGIKHHVDHVVPLTSKSVCGLHVPWNLQIIPATENLKKANRVLLWL